MIPVADPFMTDIRPSGIQRGRGGFYRSADGAPYVTDPDGVLVQTGERKGQVKRVKYGSPSGTGRLIENDVGLTKHKQRMSLLGIGMDEGLREACKALSDLEPGSDEFRKAADTIVVEADNLTRSWLAADRGSHGHLICELYDRGESWTHVVADGEALGLTEPTQRQVHTAWHNLWIDNGLEILAIEASCVDDRWRLAGTLDRIVRCTRVLRFAMPGQIVVIPAGTVLILDIKFGLIRRAHLIQVASYRQSVPYDTEAEVRGEWPWPISAEHALIAHGDFGGDGVPVTFELVWVDLAAGREHGGETVVQAKTWSARDDLWSIAQLDVEGAASPVVAPRAPSAQHSPDTPTVPVTAGDAVSADPTPSPATSTEALVREQGVKPITNIDDLRASDLTKEEADAFLAAIEAPREALVTTSGEPWVAIDECTGGFDCRAEKHTHGCSNDRPCPHEALAWAGKPVAVPPPALPTDPDEGSSVHLDELFNALEVEYHTLAPDARLWIKALIGQAMRHAVSFHAHNNRTERRYWLIRGLVCLGHAHLAEDEVLRALVADALDSDAPLFTAVAPGHALGACGAGEAEKFAALVDRLLAGGLVPYLDESSLLRLRPTAA